MKLSASAFPILVVIVTVPVVSAWSCGPGFGRYGVLMPPNLMMDTVTAPEQIRRRQQEFMNRAFTRTSPRYEILDTDEEIKISIDVPGVKSEDINVTLDDDGKVLSVSGRREKVGESGSYTSKFLQSFSLDTTVDIEKFSANLKDGVLVVTAPKDLKRIENNIRKIPVTASDTDVSNIVSVEDVPPTQNQLPDDADNENTDKVDN